jgi:benzoate-CoA ligase
MRDWEATETGEYNLAADLLAHNLRQRPDKIAYIDARGRYSYAELGRLVEKCGAALLAAGLKPRDRLALCVLDGIDFVAAFLGAVRVGIVPIALNTLLTADDYAYIIADSGAAAAAVSSDLTPAFEQAIRATGRTVQLITSGDEPGGLLAQAKALQDRSSDIHWAAPTDIAFWLYSSGSTGRPKGTPHRHSSPALAARLFAINTFGLREDDIVFSAAKLFFAYGIGNGLFFPLAAGATVVLYPGRVTPAVVAQLIEEQGVTVFCGVPTLYASILETDFPGRRGGALRICMSAGESLPHDLGATWTERTGTEIIDGIGSTEMLHIFVSNRPGAVRYGVTGWPVEGYEVKLQDEGGEPVEVGQIGELYVKGPTVTPAYWNQPEKTRATFIDGWMKTGDKFILNSDGSLQYCGRADDMLKISGIWVSPSEVESCLVGHEAVLEAAVIGVLDQTGLMKTKAFVIPAQGHEPGEALAETLRAFAKSQLAPYKYPRMIEFVAQLPKTATGKIRRHVLREQEQASAEA